MCVHQTGDKIVTLHSILMRRSIRKMCERRFTRFVVLEFPVIAQLLRNIITYWPVVIFPGDGILQRTALRMALDTDVIGCHKTLTDGVHDIRARRMLDMFAPRAVASLTTHIPFCHM